MKSILLTRPLSDSLDTRNALKKNMGTKYGIRQVLHLKFYPLFCLDDHHKNNYGIWVLSKHNPESEGEIYNNIYNIIRRSKKLFAVSLFNYLVVPFNTGSSKKMDGI